MVFGKMSFYDNRYHYLNKLFLSLIGQWPYQSRWEGNVMMSITLFFICTLTALEFWGLVKGITNFSIIMENGTLVLVNSMVFVKLINYIYNKYNMKQLLEQIEETWKITQVTEEVEILRNYAEQSRIFSIKYTFIFYTVWLFFTVSPLAVSRGYRILTNKTYTARFLYRLEHVIDMEKYFNLLMFHGFVSVFYLVSVIIAIDCIFITYIQHVTALFEIIRYNIECIEGVNVGTYKPDVADDEVYHTIIQYVKSHKQALRFSELLSSSYAMSYLFLLGDVIISLSFSAAELIIVDNQFDEILKITAVSVAQLLHIYYMSWICQRLIDHSSGLHEAIYSCKWYTISLRSRQLLHFMLLRTTKPCEIKAGKMYVMSMENFSSILQVSISYFTMLTSMQ